MTMYDGRTKLAEQVVAEVKAYFGPRVYESVIPRSVRLAEAPGFGQPITRYDPGSRGAMAYVALAGELLTRPAGDGLGDRELEELSQRPVVITAEMLAGSPPEQDQGPPEERADGPTGERPHNRVDRPKKRKRSTGPEVATPKHEESEAA